MNRMKLVQKVTFCAAHRLMDTDTVCKNIHGHNYDVWFTICGEKESDGMIIDFFDLEKICQDLVDLWDHSLMLRSDDPIIKALEGLSQKIVVFEENPTCEEMVLKLSKYFPKLPNNSKLTKIRLKEMEQYEVEIEIV